MKYLTEISQETQQTAEIIGTIFGIVFCILLIAGFFLCVYWDIKTQQLRNDYIKSLNDHDKAVIANYKATYFKFSNKNGILMRIRKYKNNYDVPWRNGCV